MSAVPKQTISIWNVIPAEDEPEFFGEEGLDLAPFPGDFRHSQHDLHCLWSLVWKRWGSERVCYEIIRYNRLFSVEWWREAIEETWITKPKMNHLRYVMAMASSFKKEGTPTERMAKKIAEAELANKATKYAIIDSEDPDIKAFGRRNKEAPLEDMASHPVTLRYKNRIRGDQ